MSEQDKKNIEKKIKECLTKSLNEYKNNQVNIDALYALIQELATIESNDKQ